MGPASREGAPAALVAEFETLAPESRRRRFLAPVMHLSDSMLERLVDDVDGIDHVGVLVGAGEFPHEQTIEAAERIAAAIRPPSKFSALFLTHDTSLIERCARKLRPHIVHLGAAADLLLPPHVAELKGKAITQDQVLRHFFEREAA